MGKGDFSIKVRKSDSSGLLFDIITWKIDCLPGGPYH